MPRAHPDSAGLGHRAYQAHRVAGAFRRHDEAALLELARIRHDRHSYVSTARQRIRDLEDLLTSEIETREEWRDAGWDAESLRRECGGS